MIDKVYTFIGLIQKSGNLSSGSDAVEMDIKKNKCKLLIISIDASENTKEKFEKLAKQHNICYVYFGNKADFGFAIGKPDRTVLSIKDQNFSKGLLSKIEENIAGGEHIVKN
jgi:ribosomal protein L7Ae-like RNA K-turn-binding protein